MRLRLNMIATNASQHSHPRRFYVLVLLLLRLDLDFHLHQTSSFSSSSSLLDLSNNRRILVLGVAFLVTSVWEMMCLESVCLFFYNRDRALRVAKPHDEYRKSCGLRVWIARLDTPLEPPPIFLTTVATRFVTRGEVVSR